MKNRAFSTAVVIRGLSIALAAGLAACSDTPLPVEVEPPEPPEPLQLHGALAFGYSGDANGAFVVSVTFWLEPDGRLREGGSRAYAIHHVDDGRLSLIANRPRAESKSDLVQLIIRDVVLSIFPQTVDSPSFGGTYEVNFESGYDDLGPWAGAETRWVTHAGKVEYRVTDGRIIGTFEATACSGPAALQCPPPADWPGSVPPQIELSGGFDLPLLRSEGGRLSH